MTLRITVCPKWAGYPTSRRSALGLTIGLFRGTQGEKEQENLPLLCVRVRVCPGKVSIWPRACIIFCLCPGLHICQNVCFCMCVSVSVSAAVCRLTSACVSVCVRDWVHRPDWPTYWDRHRLARSPLIPAHTHSKRLLAHKFYFNPTGNTADRLQVRLIIPRRLVSKNMQKAIP